MRIPIPKVFEFASRRQGSNNRSLHQVNEDCENRSQHPCRFKDEGYRHIGVVGLGVTGLSAVRFLKQCGVQVSCFDSRLNPPCLTEVQPYAEKIKCETLEHSDLQHLDAVMVSPGLSLQSEYARPLVESGLPLFTDMELFAYVQNAPTIGITGSNGKSTVTTLVGEIAREAGLNVKVGGNLGTPVLDLWTEAPPDLYVLELSSFQLELTYSLKLKAATILNLSPDHLDRYPDMKAYLDAKQRIYQHAEHCIVNADDKATYPYESNQHIVTFSVTKPADFYLSVYHNEMTLMTQERALLPISKLNIQGRHNHANTLAALALSKAAGIDEEVALRAVQAFKGLPHRCQWVAEKNQIRFYNDSKGTNTGATIATLEGLAEVTSGKIILILGGQGKGEAYDVLRTPVEKYCRAVVLIGEEANAIHAALERHIPLHRASSMQDALHIAAEKALAGDAILLSPACTSFDMFRNYAERGDVFTQLAREYCA